MKIKKIVACLVTALVLTFSPLNFGSVKAEASLESNIETLSSGYEVVTSFYNDGGEFNSSNVSDIVNATSLASVAGEEIRLSIGEEEYLKSSYRNMYTDVFQIYKNALVYLIENSYDEALYSQTNGGVVLLHQKVNEYTNLIKSSTNHESATSNYNEFIEFINSNALAKKTKEVSTTPSQEIKVKATSQSPIFSEDDYLTASYFVDSVIIKNTKVALMNNEKLLDETSGVATYISIRWKSNDVIVEGSKVPEIPVTFEIDVSSLNVEIDSESLVQVVRYLGNRKVEFIESAKLQNGVVTFTLQSFGEDIATSYDLDFAIVTKNNAITTSSIVATFAEENLVLIITIAGAVVLLWMIVKISKSIRARRKKKMLKAFKKQYKKMLKQKKLDKKQKRKEKKLKKKAKNKGE